MKYEKAGTANIASPAFFFCAFLDYKPIYQLMKILKFHVDRVDEGNLKLFYRGIIDRHHCCMGITVGMVDDPRCVGLLMYYH